MNEGRMSSSSIGLVRISSVGVDDLIATLGR
jgi:hypothetical protein